MSIKKVNTTQKFALYENEDSGNKTRGNNMLYADSYVDLVALDISDPRNIKVIERLQDIYPNKPFVAEETVWNENIDQEKGVVVEREQIISNNVGLGCSRRN